jgi:hypothetical protein
LVASEIINILSQDEVTSSGELLPILPGKKEVIPIENKYTFRDDFISCKNISFVVSLALL